MSDAIEFFPISTEQTSWKSSQKLLSEIRHKVFVKEQGVPEELEIDDQDPQALHWIAWGSGDTAMGVARLAGNKIGRMAILKPYRKKGVGSTLLRAIVNYAIRNGFTTLQADAQQHAVVFYENNGFRINGKVFNDAGIPHVPMVMDIDRFTFRHEQKESANAREQNRNRESIENADSCVAKALELVEQGDRTLYIFSQRLDPLIYDSDAFSERLYNLATSHPNAKVKLLVADTPWLSRHYHRVIDTYHRLLSHIELRRLNPELDTLHTEFMVADNEAVYYLQDPHHFKGYYCASAPAEAQSLANDFEVMWQSSLPDPEVRRLYI
jgi:predicted GNAT family N-acyltransferase